MHRHRWLILIRPSPQHLGYRLSLHRSRFGRDLHCLASLRLVPNHPQSPAIFQFRIRRIQYSYPFQLTNAAHIGLLTPWQFPDDCSHSFHNHHDTTLLHSLFIPPSKPFDPLVIPCYQYSMAKPSKALLQSLRLQQLALQSAETLAQDLSETKDKELRAKQSQALSSIIKAFDTLEDRKRILNGKPMPGSLRPEAKPKKRPRSYGQLRVVEADNIAESMPTSAAQTIGTTTINASKESLNSTPVIAKAGGEGV